MGIGVSVFLIAVGAILTFAIHASSSGFDINTIGIILMIVGAIGLLTSLFVFGPRRTRTEYVEERVVRDHDHVHTHAHGEAPHYH